MSPVFQQGRWQLVNDVAWIGHNNGFRTKVVTALHDCSIGNPGMYHGDWSSSNNVQNGSCYRCGEEVPEDITTIWKLLNFDILAE